MSIALTTPVTGTAQTGLTSPTYTVAVDTAPSANMKQWAVTATGGTQTGVEAHSVSAPFTTSFVRPMVYKPLGPVNPVTGVLRSIPRNVHKVITRKGVVPLAGQAYATLLIETVISVPSGSDVADPESIRAALSMHIGSLSQASSSVGDLCVAGIL